MIQLQKWLNPIYIQVRTQVKTPYTKKIKLFEGYVGTWRCLLIKFNLQAGPLKTQDRFL